MSFLTINSDERRLILRLLPGEDLDSMRQVPSRSLRREVRDEMVRRLRKMGVTLWPGEEPAARFYEARTFNHLAGCERVVVQQFRSLCQRIFCMIPLTEVGLPKQIAIIGYNFWRNSLGIEIWDVPNGKCLNDCLLESNPRMHSIQSAAVVRVAGQIRLVTSPSELIAARGRGRIRMFDPYSGRQLHSAPVRCHTAVSVVVAHYHEFGPTIIFPDCTEEAVGNRLQSPSVLRILDPRDLTEFARKSVEDFGCPPDSHFNRIQGGQDQLALRIGTGVLGGRLILWEARADKYGSLQGVPRGLVWQSFSFAKTGDRYDYYALAYDRLENDQPDQSRPPTLLAWSRSDPTPSVRRLNIQPGWLDASVFFGHVLTRRWEGDLMKVTRVSDTRGRVAREGLMASKSDLSSNQRTLVPDGIVQASSNEMIYFLRADLRPGSRVAFPEARRRVISKSVSFAAMIIGAAALSALVHIGLQGPRRLADYKKFDTEDWLSLALCLTSSLSFSAAVAISRSPNVRIYRRVGGRLLDG